MLLLEIVGEIERLFKDKYENNANVISAFVIGSMASNTYEEKSSNDYDIRIVVSKVTRSFLLEFEQFLKQLCMLSNDIEIEYDSSIGPVFHNITSGRRLLLHALVLTCDIIEDLPKSHRLTYSLNYRNIFGADLLKKYKSISLSIEDIVFCREGLIDCRDMLKNGLIAYDRWKISPDVKLNTEYRNIDIYSVTEICNYSIVKFVRNWMLVIESHNLYFNEQAQKDFLISMIPNIDVAFLNDIYDKKMFVESKDEMEMIIDKTLAILQEIIYFLLEV